MYNVKRVSPETAGRTPNALLLVRQVLTMSYCKSSRLLSTLFVLGDLGCTLQEKRIKILRPFHYSV